MIRQQIYPASGLARGMRVTVQKGDCVVSVAVQDLRRNDLLVIDRGVASIFELHMYWSPWYYRLHLGGHVLGFGQGQIIRMKTGDVPVESIFAGDITASGRRVNVRERVNAAIPVYQPHVCGDYDLPLAGIGIRMRVLPYDPGICRIDPIETEGRVRIPVGYE